MGIMSVLKCSFSVSCNDEIFLAEDGRWIAVIQPGNLLETTVDIAEKSYRFRSENNNPKLFLFFEKDNLLFQAKEDILSNEFEIHSGTGKIYLKSSSVNSPFRIIEDSREVGSISVKGKTFLEIQADFEDHFSTELKVFCLCLYTHMLKTRGKLML